MTMDTSKQGRPPKVDFMREPCRRCVVKTNADGTVEMRRKRRHEPPCRHCNDSGYVLKQKGAQP